MSPFRHQWLRLPRRDHLAAALTGCKLHNPRVMEPFSAHRRLRGPYTFGGAIARHIVLSLWMEQPELVRRYEVTLLTLAPELRDVVPASAETLTSLAVPSERTRFYSRLRTLRLAHGMAQFLNLWFTDVGEPVSIVVRDVHNADATDSELLAVLLRRLDPNRVQLVLCTGTNDLHEPPVESPEPLSLALNLYAERVAVAETETELSNGNRDQIAKTYIDTDCIDDDPRVLQAYEDTDPAQRAAWHDARAEKLIATGEISLRLGAVPWHREHGTDPQNAGVLALREALDYCIDAGFYEATINIGSRGRKYVTAATDEPQWWAFTTKMTTSLAAMGRAEESRELYDEARASSISPSIHQQAAYATAMLYTRHLDKSMQDHQLAKAWVNQAIAIASWSPNAERREFHAAFFRNGLALIELHLGDIHTALDLVEEGLRRIDAAFSSDLHLLHRSVLRYNRAQVLAGLGRLEESLAEYDAVIAADPNYPEYHFDRAGLLRRVGREPEALNDYDTAIRLSPPFPEAYFNRAVTRAGLGDMDGALSDLTETILLDPNNLDALINRAELYWEREEIDAARSDVAAVLANDKTRAEAHVLAGHLAREQQDDATALTAYDRAVALAPELIAAYAARAELQYSLGELKDASKDMDHAVGRAPNNAELRFNRATILSEMGHIKEAIADLQLAASLAPEDEEIVSALKDTIQRLQQPPVS